MSEMTICQEIPGNVTEIGRVPIHDTPLAIILLSKRRLLSLFSVCSACMCVSVCDHISGFCFFAASLYGQGIYFAKEANRSAYYTKPDPQGLRFMFQARVLTGEYSRGEERFVLPPMKPGGGGRYDSLVNIPSKPTIFVTFFDDHAYPEYLITFTGQAL